MDPLRRKGGLPDEYPQAVSLIRGRLARLRGGSQAPALAVRPCVELLHFVIRESRCGMQLEVFRQRHSAISHFDSQLSEKFCLLIDRISIPLGKIHVTSATVHIILNEPR